MKIIYLHQYFNTTQVAGSTRSYEFARRLVRDGHEVHLITSNREASAASKTWDVTSLEGITVHSIAQPYNNSMNARDRVTSFLMFAIRSSARARSLAGDVVFATSTPLTIVLPALVATLGRPTPFVMEVRDLWPSVPIAMGFLKNPVARFAARSLEKLAYRCAAKIIALSQGMADGVVEAGGKASDVSVITNLSDTSRFSGQLDTHGEFATRYPELIGRPFLVYTGTFGRVNGLSYMVRLAEAYSRINEEMAFVAMGDGSEKQSVIELAGQLGVLNRNFFVFDPIPKKDLPMVLAAATACSSWVVPIEELEANSANKLFDAFAAGKPMVINHGGWQKSLLSSTGAGIALPALDYSSAARELSERLSDAAWLDYARSASFKLGEEEFEVEKLYTRFVGVLISAHEKASSSAISRTANKDAIGA